MAEKRTEDSTNFGGKNDDYDDASSLGQDICVHSATSFAVPSTEKTNQFALCLQKFRMRRNENQDYEIMQN